ncbi:MAG: DUF354 domain-containing protein [Verrucomicrobiae bacterium]|nr:DUF354 domain-containing protein [Verrucomicrobiae bacterium]
MPSSLLQRCYYVLKPWLPRHVRYALRRVDVRRKFARSRDIWPILPGSETPPPNWPGWPERRQFAFVLTHDVEGTRGLERCRQLMELEAQRGFRSSFNFVPEGEYRVPDALRAELISRGFEVGVHDLHHDGSLFRSRETFRAQAPRINRYLDAWGAVGFRAGFMFHNLEWQQALRIRYDLSTFDVDPFEPQPEGVGTIFPFWVGANGNGAEGFIEMPYTLAQDSTLFLFLRERTIELWKRKLDWVAEHGGLALLNVHPDYLNFERGDATAFEFPAAWYAELLDYVRSKYGDRCWHALPCEVAEYCARFKPEHPGTRGTITAPGLASAGAGNGAPGRNGTPRVKIWIDLDNTPHVPLFVPIVRELERRGHQVVLTARDAFQVCELAEQKGLPCRRIGRHYGRNRLLKALGLLWRSLQLTPVCFAEKPQLALSHGSRSKELLGRALGIPTVSMNDYEHSAMVPLAPPRWVIVPDSISEAESGGAPGRVRQYRGIKEDVYAPEFQPDERLLDELGLRGATLIVTVRPPADEAHYHNPEAERLLQVLMERLCATEGARVVLLPRNRAQEQRLRAAHPEWFAGDKTVVPARAVDGMNLVWFSDLVVSGGGTMNREAAALGVPVYSIFRGKIGAVDRRLEAEGRLVLVRTPEDVHTKIRLVPRDKRGGPNRQPRPALDDIVNHIEEIIRIEYGNGH